jgi:O-antigen biosynthesis protein
MDGVMLERERARTEAEEIRQLRREAREKDKLIGQLTDLVNSPLFLLKAAVRNIVRLIPFLIERRRKRKAELAKTQQLAEVVRASGMFETDWYLEQYPDVARSGIDPIVHYLLSGAAERRDPSRTFSTRIYLENYPDVADLEINPLLHYIEYGRQEGRSAESNNYDHWVERFDTLGETDAAIFQAAIDRFARLPLISILMPVYNTEREWLIRAIESVIAQFYPHWELCISDNASTEPHVRETLERYQKQDRRIRVVYRATNEHISVNSNSALSVATGEYVALLDSDDALTPHALFWVVNEILDHPEADLVYSDEDKIDVDGRRYEAYFKPDWNPGLILSQNYVSHLGVYRRSLVEQVGAFRVGFEGSQDHDLVLRCADASAPERIRHIPRILYHWRSVAGSTASAAAIEAKPYAWHAAAKSIEEHLQRRGVAGTVEPALRLYYQVTYPPPATLPKISIVMPSACKLHLLKPCMESLFARTTYPDFELLLVVNEIRFRDRAQAAYLATLRSDPRIRILVYEDQPYNFSWLNNWAVREAAGAVLCFMNDDIEVITPDWLEKLVARLQLDRVAAVAPILYFPDDRIQHAGVIFGIGRVAGHAFIGQQRGSGGYFGRAALEQDFSCVTAACMVARRDVFDQLNGFNEDLSVAFNDVDLCIRMRRAGWRILFTPQVEMYHHESASLGRHDSPERKAQFGREVDMMRRMWGEVLDHDPFYNPNLSLTSHNFTLAFPPRVARLPEPSIAPPPAEPHPAT